MAAKRKARRATTRRTLRASAAIKASAAKSAKRAARGPRPRKARAPRAEVPAPRGRPVLHALHLSVPSCKVGLALSLMGVAHDYRHVDLAGGAQRTPEFAARNRFRQVPVLEHDGHFICQSNVILAYLAEFTGRFGGRSKPERLRVAEWLAWEQDRLAAVGHTRSLLRFEQRAADDPVMAWTRARGEAALGTLDRQLGQTKFLAGADPTIADVACFAWVAVAGEGGFEIARWPNIRAWAERMMRLPGAAHPYDLMPREDRVGA